MDFHSYMKKSHRIYEMNQKYQLNKHELKIRIEITQTMGYLKIINWACDIFSPDIIPIQVVVTVRLEFDSGAKLSKKVEADRGLPV